MSTRDTNPLMSLYGTPRSVVHTRVSVRAKMPVTAGEEKEDTEKLGQAMISLTCLKDHSTTSR
ncbi:MULTISPECIES: hypothetical protein [Rhizobium]|uniref:Uncharacterized protein n=1 Tax=Rhizobium favelukesii TaxID=348824 RepID=W6RM73_9HYPH|nr:MULTISPECIES: hypothetical protein [Rhizobium]MCA0805984.1 hypothetical protein [Rhizobium sp. T1473]MCS0462364.1 hypothetical protein [Rhizobium favelukesii]UFS85054.1 hypothetical protein LPB79_32075 [Rhizobium sp. T136]CDM60038.1 hypothetical protein LPU83_pLPU83b_0038 [Rhizobium favelukesii]